MASHAIATSIGTSDASFSQSQPWRKWTSTTVESVAVSSTASAGPLKYIQCARRSRTMSSPSFGSLCGNGIRSSAYDPRRVGGGEQRRHPAGVEEHRPRVTRHPALADGGDEPDHRLAGVDGVEDEALALGGQPQR